MNYTEKLLEVCDLHKVYTKDGVPTKALNGISFNVLNGEYLGIMSGTPKKYEIADIKVVGAKNYEDYVIIGLSGLSKGQTPARR